MTQTIQKPDIFNILQAEGVELKQRGKYFWSLCAFHPEKTPSFCINPERQRWKCFGCGEQGDVVDFVMRLKGISFPDALQYLGIRGDSPVRTIPQEVRRRELVGKFRLWCDDYSKYLCENLRLCNCVDALIRTPEDFAIDGISEMYLLRDVYQYHLAILGGADDKSRFELYQEVKFGTGI